MAAGALVSAAALSLTYLSTTTATAQAPAPALTPLPESKPASPALVALGRQLFFDQRLAGDWGNSCASCHSPTKGFGDGMPLSLGYTSMEYFRNAPTLINARHRKRFMWDGRLDGADAGTAVRDMVTEAHFMHADGRIVQERLKQIPEYVVLWEAAFGKGSEPYSPRMFNAIGAFVQSLESKNVPYDRFVKGDASALSAEAKAGLAVFNGKGQCVQCHNGPIGSDGKFHRLGVPEHPDVLGNPLRTITMLRHYATSGMPNYMNARTDVGFYAISKDAKDIGKFQTPSLRELKVTAPYMHNGVFQTLDEVVDFYDRGGGGKGTDLKPLGLSAEEKKGLVAFLLSLSGDPITINEPELPDLQVRTNFGKN
ncbi:MAG: cytochrome c peroxidase [Aquabacterium commune]|uniref:cytochrome-c peroxidase n=1 Tax=Aquabacterium commune TaxID=70586 RepID=UPI003BAF4AE1